MSSDWAYETAKAIVDDTRFNFYYSPHYERQWTLDAIAAALRTAHKVPEGCVLDDKGVDRKVLGTPDFDNEGRMVGLSGEFYTEHAGEVIRCFTGTACFAYVGNDRQRVNLALVVSDLDSEEDAALLHTLYPSEEAALAARGEGK